MQNELFDSSPSEQSRWDDEKLLAMWPQVRGDLQAMANQIALRTGSTYVCDGIRMAVVLADRQVEAMKSPLLVDEVV